jgi:peptidoglycan/LPS O-acetylase OafA/YrhL
LTDFAKNCIKIVTNGVPGIRAPVRFIRPGSRGFIFIMYSAYEDTLGEPVKPGTHAGKRHYETIQSKYRADVDGLRAVAVLAVLLNHLYPAWLPGGFAGVDIFFVISGFVITGKIYPEAADGRFSFKQFYKRRINRIVPALMAVLAVTGMLGAILLSPADLVRLAICTISSVLSVSNIYLWREYGNYFSANAGEAPLLHTWSLGVEEQFYVVWPFVIVALARLRPGRAAVLLALMAVAGAMASEFAVNRVASASYYLLPTRFFELMMGGLLAFPVLGGLARNVQIVRVCRGLGYGFIAWALLFLDGSSPFPGVNALLPCAGAALIVFAGMNPRSESRFLTARPLVFTGLISYSLYLWHWPVIAYLNYLNIEIGAATGIGAAAVSFLLAWVSWRYIEAPLRRSGNSLGFAAVLGGRFVAPSGIAIALSVAVILAQGIPQRFGARVVALERAVQTKPDEIRSLCHVPGALYRTPPNPSCKLGMDKPAPDGLLIGDSFANHFTGMLDVLAKASGLQILDYTMSACPPVLGYRISNGPVYAAACLARNEAIYASIGSKQYRLIILAASWPNEEIAGRQLKASIDEILRSGAKLTIVLGNEGIAHAESCPVRNAMYGLDRSCSGKRAGPPSYFARIRELYPQVQIIDPNSVICGENRCNPVLGGTVLYRDGAHLNDVGSRLIGEALLARAIRLQPVD